MAIEELFFEGKTLDLALDKAAEELGEDKDMLIYDVVQMPTKGIFGIGATPAKIKIERTVPDAPAKKEKKPAPEKKEQEVKLPEGFVPEKISKKQKSNNKPAKENKAKSAPIVQERTLTPVAEGDEVAAAIEKFILGLLTELEIADGKVTVSLDENGSYYADVAGSKMGVLIGRRGETLDAVQYLTTLVVNRGKDEKVKVVLDSENYRAKRFAALETLANKTADKAIKYKRNQTLEPMDAYERRIIHAALTDREHINTYSVGTEPRRKVVVAYVK